MARKRRSVRRYFSRRRHGHADRRVPILPIIGLGIGLTQGPAGNAIQQAADGNFEEAFKIIGHNFTGYYDGTFNVRRLINGWAPVIAGFIGSKIASATGVNRAIKRVPMVGRYIKL